MLKLNRLVMCATAVSLPVAAAQAITYTASRSVGASGSVKISITTDDKIGALLQSDVLSWTIGLSDSHGTFTLNTMNSVFSTTGGLTATATDLLFDFSGGSYAAFQNPYLGSSMNFFCMTGNQICGNNFNGETLLVGNEFPVGISVTHYAGVHVVAGASAVPEPESWALLFGGFGLAGGAMRIARRRGYATTGVLLPVATESGD